jgi:hypothetical protein
VTYLVMTAMVAAPRANVSTFRMVVVALSLAIFLPPLEPLGEALYDAVARNRRRLMPGAACKIE